MKIGILQILPCENIIAKFEDNLSLKLKGFRALTGKKAFYNINTKKYRKKDLTKYCIVKLSLPSSKATPP